MAVLRRGGSASLFFIDGDIPSAQAPALSAALAEQRFRTIELAASEEVSFGWVTANDPSGESFELEDLDLDRAIWLQIRFDKKKLPQRWVAIYRAAAERAAGRKLNAKERKTLKEDLAEKLLPRVLPSVQIVDVLVEPKAKRAILFSTSKGAREEFVALWKRTFTGTDLLPADPFQWALHCKLAPEQRRYLEEAAPVKWPKQQRAPREGDATEPEIDREFDDSEPSDSELSESERGDRELSDGEPNDREAALANSPESEES